MNPGKCYEVIFVVYIKKLPQKNAISLKKISFKWFWKIEKSYKKYKQIIEKRKLFKKIQEISIDGDGYEKMKEY